MLHLLLFWVHIALNNSLAVEFDIWYNADSTAQISTDIIHDHVSIHSAGRRAPNTWYVTLR
jgi:hypothetical protein